MNGKLCITVEEMDELLGIGRSKAYEVARRADFPAVRLGRKLLISVKGLEEWVARQAGGMEKAG
jgi:excisionase family DNA binding protein